MMTEKLEREFAHFIEFGHLLDRASRRYLVGYLRDRIESDGGDAALLSTEEPSARASLNELPASGKESNASDKQSNRRREAIREELRAIGTTSVGGDQLNDIYLGYLRHALDRIFRIDRLIPLMRGNDRITERVVLDTLYWIRKTYTKTLTEHPYTEELSLLRGWSVTPMREFRRRYPFLLKRLKENYTKTELDPGFYEAGFRRYLERDFSELGEDEQRKLERLFTDLLSQWDALLQAKILEYQLSHLEEEEEAFGDLMEAKVTEYQRLYDILSPVTDYLGWDLSRDLWQDTTLDIVRHYDELLAREDSLKELAELLGKMREAEIELEEETFEKTIVRREWVVDPLARSEIVGVHESRDLNNLVSSEVGLLGERATEDLFLQKYADHSLLTFRYEDRRLVSSRDQLMEVHQRTRLKEKGPFIVCVDTSESMHGRPELIAKVLCLGILKMAMRENRRAYLINFSVGIKTIDLLDVANSLEEVAAFLQMSFYGGTDASLALYEALRQLKTNDYEDADVLMISDFVMYKIDRDVLGEIAFFQQNKNTEFHSLAISKEANGEILERFDTNWLYDPKQKGIIREMTRGLEDIGSRE